MDISFFKNTLEQEKVILEKELHGLGVFNATTNQWEATPDTTESSGADANENADRFETYEERTATLSVLARRYADVVDALTKIQQGTYGICENSGTPIHEDRLRANPAARTNI